MLKNFIEKHFPYLLENFKDSPRPTLIKWNWNYSEYLEFLSKLNPFLREYPKESLFIICSHPHSFTMGSGLQRDQKNLIDFNPEQAKRLPFPYHKIKRGGGLTFHYPGQIIFYPMMNLNATKTSVTKVMVRTLQVTKNILEEVYNLQDLDYKNKLFGLWKGNTQKIASIGMGLERFVTQHGLALNFYNDSKMFQALSDLNPCGLQGNIYQPVERFVSKENLDREDFTNIFLSQISKFY